MIDFAETLNASLAALFSRSAERAISHRPIKVDKYYESAYEISCHMGFFDTSGKNAGVALLNINKADLIEMWRNVLGMPMPEDADATEIATELVNMIVGNASAKFSEKGQKIRIALPQIIHCDHQIRLSTMKRDDFHYFEFRDERLRFNWVLCFYEVIGFAT